MSARPHREFAPFTPFEPADAAVRSAKIATHPDHYPTQSNLRAEIRRARGIYQSLLRATGQLFADVRVGRALNPKLLARPLARMIASVVRNPEAMIWMRRLHPPLEPYLVAHSVRTSVLAVVLARQMGMAKPQLERVGTAALLCQIGKTKLPTKLLEQHAPLSDEALTRLRHHVELAGEIFSHCPTMPPDVVEIVIYHLERYDGSGVPGGKAGDQIPLLARIVGMVEWYDAMTSVKPYTRRILNTTESMDYLYQQRDVLFQEQLVDEFIRAIGIYPNGTLVELNSRDVALVQAQDPRNRTQPRLLIVRSANGRELTKYINLDLAEFNRKTDVPLTIKRALTPAECELDVNQVIESLCRSLWQRLLQLT